MAHELACGCVWGGRSNRECTTAKGLVHSANVALKAGDKAGFWRNMADAFAHQGNDSDQLKAEHAYEAATI